ncbi:hypothetical protein JOM56_011954, partial [Amanita muscaria]
QVDHRKYSYHIDLPLFSDQRTVFLVLFLVYRNATIPTGVVSPMAKIVERKSDFFQFRFFVISLLNFSAARRRTRAGAK